MKLSAKICNAAAWLVCGTLACSSDRPARTANDDAVLTPASGTVTPTRSDSATTAARNDRETTVQVSADLRSGCRFPEAPAELPRFELDQSTLRAPDKNILDDVARCLSEGPLQNRTITIIGRADPRGTEEHNRELGANRAEATRNYLIQKGVPREKLLVISRGEEGAQGSNEDTWALDRRVDLVLGDRTERTSINQDPPANASSSKASPYADQSEGGPASGKVIGTSGPGTDSVPGK